MDLQEFLKITVVEYCGNLGDYISQDIRIPCYMKDGEYHSIQASKYHYCRPQVDWRDLCGRFYTHLELAGGLSDKDLQVMGLDERDYNGVYGYVPIEDVEKFINNHGGIDSDKVLKEIMVKELKK